MRPEDKQQYLDMSARVFVRALRDPDSGQEYELSEGEATDLLVRREQRSRIVRLETALEEIANHGSGALGHVQNVTLLSATIARIAREALQTDTPHADGAEDQ